MSTTHAKQDSSEEESLLPSNNNNDTSVNSNRRVRSYDSIIRLASYRREGKWPITLWLVLTFLCVFWHRRILKKRKCYVCYVTSVTRGCDNQTNSQSMLLDPLSLEYEYDGELWQNENDGREQRTMGNDEDVEECSVCNVTLWNYHGERTQFTDKSTGGSLWVSRCSKYISLIVLLLAIASILYDLGYYIDRMWGRQNKLLHFISYNAFLVCLSIYPMMNICSKFRSFFGKKENVSFLDWAGSLNARFIIKRMQFMNLAEKVENSDGSIVFLNKVVQIIGTLHCLQ
ncbi:hypothetical protein BSL78_01350 [Apostichopus japonicus]|uniref:Uncharacterized protein n=1 Tax=Stichopus japonicus TaxID=307972 RepID=A0A2G8LNG6_STIJA|nr:hypothetical protein BSL78_01350 [Apostichopus japonicus]